MSREQFDKLRAAQFRSLLGREFFAPGRVVITPLNSLYTRLAETVSISEEKEFYKNARMNIPSGKASGSGNGLIVYVPQGIQAQDILWMLPKCAVLFLGFAGSPGAKRKIGSIVETVETLDEGGRVYPLDATGRYSGIRCGFSPCLLGPRSEKCCQNGLACGCHAIEMETAALASSAKMNGQQMTAWLLITDEPGAVGFWEVDELQRQSVNTAQKELTAAAANWINGGAISR